MSELYRFVSGERVTAVALPLPLDQVVTAWTSLTRVMIRERPEAFTRDEWAYLIAFLCEGNLRRPFAQAFGAPTPDAEPVDALATPRGPIAVWLPNNVSLLGPLMLVLASLVGTETKLKGGSSAGLTGAFLAFCREHVSDPLLLDWLQRVDYAEFDHDDPRHAAWSKAARVRVVFGSDAAARAILGLEHPLDGASFAFVDRRSQAWLEPEVVDDALLTDLIKVAAIYGQAGCTSPRRVVLLGADAKQATDLRDRLRDLWPTVIPNAPSVGLASGNVAARQLAAARGWDAALVAQNAAVLATGSGDLPELEAPVGLEVVGCTEAEAVATLPDAIQTVGHGLVAPQDPRWLALLARTAVKRFVPVAEMHRFDSVWDGHDFWRQCFDLTEVRLGRQSSSSG